MNAGINELNRLKISYQVIAHNYHTFYKRCNKKMTLLITTKLTWYVRNSKSEFIQITPYLTQYK